MALSRKVLGFLTLILILGALGTGMYFRLRADPEEAAQGPSSEGGAVLPESASEQFATNVTQPVVGAVVVRDTLWITVSAAGQAEAFRRTALQSRVSGIIRNLPVRENRTVPERGLLLQVDTTDYALTLARARADHLSAQARFEEMIFFDDEITDPAVRAERARLSRARSGLAQAEVSLQEAVLNLEETSVKAPFPGRVANLRVVEGEHVGPGTELMTIVDLDPIKVEVQVLEREVGYLTEGRRASVTFAAFPGETFTGRVSTINPVVDPEFRTARVTVHLANPEGRIKPGMYARVSLEAQFFPDRILVPRSAILEKDRRDMLFVFEDGRAKWRYVTRGRESDLLVEIIPNEATSMVEPGEIVLVDNHFYLQHDAQVQLVEAIPGGSLGGNR
ncbi:MAG: efflux RND transporter periplasmic adaptor subunit [Longimicrobiales bacterium]|nr:efflux RND transporter periplasmic adaptor subunit [Longimicrobiales bacterium]